MTHRRHEGLTAITALAAVASMFALLVLAPQAGASKVMGGFIGGLAAPDPAPGGSFSNPRDLASYTGNDADPANDKIFTVEGFGALSQAIQTSRVQRFDRDGNFERSWGRDVIIAGRPGDTGPGFEICTVAADCKKGELGTAKGELTQSSGIAIDQDNEWVYVLDRSNFRIQKYDLDGNFVATFGRDVNQTAVDALAPQAQRDVCTQVSGDVCKAGVAGTGAGQLGAITTTTATATQYPRIAVHPVTHDVFAVDPGNGAAGNRRVLQLSSAGAFVRAWGYGVDTGAAQFQVCTASSTCQAANAAGTANGQLANNPQHIAVDANGIVYVSDANSGAAANRIIRFDADLAPSEPGPPFPDASAALLPALTTGAPMPDAATQGLEIDPDSGHLFALRDPAAGNTVVQEVSDPGAAAPPDPSPPALFDTHQFAATAGLGLGVGPGGGLVYVTATMGASAFPACGSCAGIVVLGENAAQSPTAAILGTLDPDADGATLQGRVDPTGSVATYRFEISQDGSTWTAVGAESYVGGSSEVTVTRQVDGLASNTLYRVRLVATKYTSLTALTTVTSTESVFVTDAQAPEATTLPPSPRRATSAGLQGKVNPNGAPTTYYFEYGPTQTYGQRMPIPDGSAGSASTEKAVVQPVEGLEPATVYHYRLVAESAYGVAVGEDVAFTTRSTVSAPEGRAYELVSRPDKATGPGLGAHGNHSQLGGEMGLSVGLPSVLGDRFISMAVAGPVLGGDSASVYIRSYDLAERCAAGAAQLPPGCGGRSGTWINHSAFNRPNYGQTTVTPFFEMTDASDDLSLTRWSHTGGFVMLFPEQADWPSDANVNYLRDWDGAWRILAPTDPVDSAISMSSATNGDGSVLVTSQPLDGLLGAGDPSVDQVAGAHTAYVIDVDGAITDQFDDRGPTALLAACTGSGASRTVIPAVSPSGDLEAQPCADPAPGRDASLVSDRGAVIRPSPVSSVQRLVSDDGARAFFMSPDPGVSGATGQCSGIGTATVCPPQLYVRQLDENGTPAVRWISRSAVAGQDAALLAAAGGSDSGAYYEGASLDGDKVFFRTNAPLTADDPNGAVQQPGGVTTGTASDVSWDLYMYDFPDAPGADPGSGVLTRVSAGPTGAGDGNVMPSPDTAALRFVSEDGSRAYFTTAAALPGVPAPGSGTTTTPGGTPTTTDTANLYAYDANAPAPERWRFVARLPRSVGGTIDACATTGGSGGELRTGAPLDQGGLKVEKNVNCLRGTAGGDFITFWTSGRLTGDDPDAASGDIYGYDAAADALTRISAPQGGTGGSYTCLTIGNVQCYGDPGFVGPGARLKVVTHPDAAADRVAYFESRSRLVPEDGDDAMDVYEWRNGELSLFSTGVEGDLSLSIPGEQNRGAYESGISRTGRDVFLTTQADLSWQDVDAVMDAYDARIGGGFNPPVPPEICQVLADGCQTATADPEAAAPATNDDGGGGNAAPGTRGKLTIASLSAKARRRAARTGVLNLTVRTTTSGRVSARAMARLGGKTSLVARGSRRIGRPGETKIRLPLSPRARRVLGAGRALRLRINVVDTSGARPRSTSVVLRRAGR